MEGCNRQGLGRILVAESKWYEEARRSRAGWRATYQDGLANHSMSRAVRATMAVCEVVCEVCSVRAGQ